MEFHLNNGLNVYFAPPEFSIKIKVRDFNTKAGNTYLYNVTHKNDRGR